MKFTLGGPAYRMEVDARHAACMAELTAVIALKGDEVRIDYEHGVPVELPRNMLFERALDLEQDVIIWADSDVYWSDSGRLVVGAKNAVLHGWPCLAVPVPQRDGVCNILPKKGGKRLHGRFKTGNQATECWAAGTGLIIFNLGWYRKHWDKGPWFRTVWQPYGGRQESPASQLLREAGFVYQPVTAGFLSEDFWHTSRLAEDFADGDSCRWAPLVNVVHAARGG